MMILVKYYIGYVPIMNIPVTSNIAIMIIMKMMIHHLRVKYEVHLSTSNQSRNASPDGHISNEQTAFSLAFPFGPMGYKPTSGKNPSATIWSRLSAPGSGVSPGKHPENTRKLLLMGHVKHDQNSSKKHPKNLVISEFGPGTWWWIISFPYFPFIFPIKIQGTPKILMDLSSFYPFSHRPKRDFEIQHRKLRTSFLSLSDPRTSLGDSYSGQARPWWHDWWGA